MLQKVRIATSRICYREVWLCLFKLTTTDLLDKMEGSPHPGRMEVRRTRQNHAEWGGSEDVQDAICQSEMEVGINKQQVHKNLEILYVSKCTTHTSFSNKTGNGNGDVGYISKWKCDRTKRMRG